MTKNLVYFDIKKLKIQIDILLRKESHFYK